MERSAFLSINDAILFFVFMRGRLNHDQQGLLQFLLLKYI